MRKVLVTGSSRGIGKAVALFLAEDGFEVVLHCRSDLTGAQGVQAELRELGRSAKILQFDISDRQECRQVLTAEIEEFGPFYGVVCNAGITKDKAFPALEGEDWDSVVHTNLDGFYNVLHPLIMPMVRAKKGGRIVTMSSVSGIMGNRGQVNYSASKAGIIGATKALAVELAKRKITVNCVAPGLIETEMTEDIPLEHVQQLVPLRRMGRPEEVASLVRYLFSDLASYLTRQVLSVNGGLL